VIYTKKSLASGLIKGSSLPAHFEKKIIISKKKQDQDQIENNDIMEFIMENLPEHYEEATEAAVHLHKAATDLRETERKERLDRREQREKLELQESKKRLEEAKKNNLEETSGSEASEQVPAKKPQKTKVINRKDSDGWVTVKVVDEEGKELEKPKPEEKSEKPAKAPKRQPLVLKTDTKASNNIFTIANEMETVLSPSEYQSSLRENKLKGQPEKPPKNKARKPVENNNEKGKESVDNKKSSDKN